MVITTGFIIFFVVLMVMQCMQSVFNSEGCADSWILMPLSLWDFGKIDGVKFPRIPRHHCLVTLGIALKRNWRGGTFCWFSSIVPHSHC